MEKYEYAHVVGYNVSEQQSNSAEAWLMETGDMSYLLDSTSMLTALNEIGREGWVVYYQEPFQRNSSSPTEMFAEKVEQRYGWRPDSVSGRAMFSLRRRIS